MLPWRHSDAWWAFTCWACHFVAFEKAGDTEGASDDLQKCGSEMRLWLLRQAFRSFACPSCEFVAIVREDKSTTDKP
jgi:predicted RNA-binding Zn-ribbon protein involved in translation (DUF1610 family)